MTNTATRRYTRSTKTVITPTSELDQLAATKYEERMAPSDSLVGNHIVTQGRDFLAGTNYVNRKLVIALAALEKVADATFRSKPGSYTKSDTLSELRAVAKKAINEIQAVSNV